MHTTPINTIMMSYRDEGNGPPLLLVHAFPLGSAMWLPQISDLSPAYRVIAPDLRGFGSSTLDEDTPNLDRYADDLAELLDHLGINRVVLGGLSMGGYIAFAFLRRHRLRVSALILADTRPQPDSAETRNAREQNAQLALTHGAGTIADLMLPKLLAPQASTTLQQQIRAIIETNDPQGIAAALRAMAARPDSTPLLATITVPTLVIVGAEDSLTPPTDARAMCAAIPQSCLVEIPGSGHLTNLETPEAFNTAVTRLLHLIS